MKQSQATELSFFSTELPAEEDTGLDYLPVFQIDNFKTMKERFGISTYESVMNLFEEINDRITQISVQLIKHLNAKVAVGEGVLSKKGEMDSSQDIFLVEKGDIVPQYITNSNALIEEGFKQIEGLIRQICTVTQTPVSFLGLEDKGGVEKVETAKLRMAAPQENQTQAAKLRGKALRHPEDRTLLRGIEEISRQREHHLHVGLGIAARSFHRSTDASDYG